MATVLIVDDHEVNRQFLLTLLGYQGHRLVEASDGAQALTVAVAEQPQVIITDILMPTMDGYEFVRQLRGIPELAHSVVIFYTAHYHGPQAAKLAAECGVEYVLIKPAEPELILHTLELALGARAPAPMPAPDFDRAHLQLVTDKLSEKVDELRRTGSRLQALIDVNLHLASESDVLRLLESVCHTARQLLGSKYATMQVRGKDAESVPLLITSGMDAATSTQLTPLREATGLIADAIRTRWVRGASGTLDVGAATGLPAGHPAVSSIIVAPIISLSRDYGWLALTDKLGAAQFSEEDQRLLGILCAQLGRTYENGALLRELKSSEQRFRTIFDNSTLGIFAVNKADQIVSANPALLRMLGHEPSATSLAAADEVARNAYLSPDERTRFRVLLKADRVVERFETRWQRIDGSTLWVSLSARMIDNTDGIGISYIGLVEDITERVRLSDAVREREAGLSHAQSMAKLAHLITGPDGSFERWSETLPQIVGVEPAQMPATTREWLSRLHPDDRQRFRDASRLAVKSRQRTDLEYRLLRPDGNVTHIRQTLEPLDNPDPDGRSRWFNTMQDISESKRAEDRIKRLNRLYAVLSAINSAIVRFHDRDELFAETCRIAVVEGGFKLAWIGEVDPVSLDGKLVAAHGADPAFIALIKFSGRTDWPRADRPAPRAIREMRPVICNDVANDPSFASMRHELAERGHLALAVFPLMVGGRCAGVLSLHAGDKNFFDEEEVKLLEELAGDVAFGLDYISKVAKLDYLAYYDVLTGLPNSTLFRDRLAQFLSRAEYEHHAVALYLIDLDSFTQVNDTLGRHAGDVLLQAVGERLRKALPNASSLARISGDTFAVAVSEVGVGAEEALAPLKELIIASLRPPFAVDGHDFHVSAHAGIALFPSDGLDADSLFKNAEAALKMAKTSSERYLFYAPDMNVKVAAKLALEGELRVAMDQGQFVLHYQPIVELNSGQITGMEALIRWQHPTRGLLSPAAFLAAIEDSELAVPVGQWVIRTACAQTKAWHEAGLPTVYCTVNISANQFSGATLLQDITDSLRQTGLDPRCLGLEITEGIVMRDVDKFIDKLVALKGLGVKLSLDDFGTGYSSLSYLKRFPIDQLKVDQSFIQDVTTSPDDAAIVRAVISVGHSMGLDMVAEGVETEAQLEWLRRHRCEKIQGYYFSRPVAAADFEKMLRERKSLATPTGATGAETKTLLIVDDETNIISALVRLLRREGYRILTAGSASEGLDLLALNSVQVIVSDHRMPLMTGAEFLSKVKVLYPDTVRILFSGQVEMETLTDAVNRGAVYRFLLKPWDDDALRESIREAFKHYWLTHRDDGDGAG